MVRKRSKMLDEAARSDVRRMAGLLAPFVRPLVLAALLLMLSSLLTLALPWAIRWLVDTVFVSHNLGQLNLIALGLLALFVIQSGLSVGNTYLVARVGQRLIADLRLRIHNRVQGLPLRFFAERRTGEIVSRVSNDVTVVQAAITETPISLLSQVVTLIGGLTLMLVMNRQLTLWIFVMIPPIIAIGMLFGRRLERLSTAVQDRLADSTVVLEEMLSGIRVVKSFAREGYEQERFGRQVEAAFSTAMQRARVRAAFIPLISFFGFGALTFLVWYGGRQVVLGTLTPGELVAFLIYMMMVAGPMASFAGLYAQLREALGAGRRVFDLLDTQGEPLDIPGAIKPGRLRGQVRFAGVGFAYNGSQPVLEDIALDVQPGEVIAIVGPSGVGKTSLVNLVPRFYDPTTGRIEIDGRDARDLDLRGLREQIGLVPQETFLFGGTIHDNIAYGRPAALEEEITQAAQAANAHEFISGFPDGYRTVVGEKGAKLSMGQRQRITIARVLLKDPRILILDEATSSLDSES
ncbi:MAG: ABC transporter ATP-binding protein/permease, partial [Anaerolineales bacterium]|nr:ABC transporter ATP-binding protein/permease [Anaerolineales bacterium]